MSNEEIMNVANEVIEDNATEIAEEAMKATAKDSNWKKIGIIGGSMALGAAAFELVIKPGYRKLKDWNTSRKAKKAKAVDDAEVVEHEDGTVVKTVETKTTAKK